MKKKRERNERKIKLSNQKLEVKKKGRKEKKEEIF